MLSKVACLATAAVLAIAIHDASGQGLGCLFTNVASSEESCEAIEDSGTTCLSPCVTCVDAVTTSYHCGFLDGL